MQWLPRASKDVVQYVCGGRSRVGIYRVQLPVPMESSRGFHLCLCEIKLQKKVVNPSSMSTGKVSTVGPCHICTAPQKRVRMFDSLLFAHSHVQCHADIWRVIILKWPGQSSTQRVQQIAEPVLIENRLQYVTYLLHYNLFNLWHADQLNKLFQFLFCLLKDKAFTHMAFKVFILKLTH